MAAFKPYMQKTPSLATGMAAPVPQKTVQPVQGFGATPPAQAPAAFNPRAMKGVDFGTIVKTAPIGQDLYNPLFATKNFTGIGDGYNPSNNRWFGPEYQGAGDLGWLQGAPIETAGSWATEMGTNEGGNPNLMAAPNQAAIDAFKDYKFDWTQGDRRSGTLTGYDPQGNKIGSWDQKPDPSATGEFLKFASLAAGGFGLAGLAGLGPLASAGVTGAGAGASGAGAAGDIGFLAANGMTDAAIAAANPALGAAGGLTGITGGAAAGAGSNFLDFGSGSNGVESLPGGDAGGFETFGLDPAPGNGAFLGENVASGVPSWDAGFTQMGGNLSQTGLTGSGVPAVFNAAKDSAAASAELGYTGAELAAGGAPASVNLGSLGNYATGGSIVDKLANALESAKVNPGGALASAGGSLVDFAKANPGLAASAVGGLGSLLGSKPEMPSGGGAPGSGGLTPGAQGVADSLGKMDFSGMPTIQSSAGDRNTFNQEAIDAAYNQQTRYLDPQIQQQQRALESRLAEQGFVPGTPAYNQAMTNFMDTNQRAYAQARDSSILQGAQIGQGDYRNAISGTQLNNSASAQALEQYLAKRNAPINERNALLNGDQITYNQQLDKYNAQVAESNNRNQSLSQLALALGMYLG